MSEDGDKDKKPILPKLVLPEEEEERDPSYLGFQEKYRRFKERCSPTPEQISPNPEVKRRTSSMSTIDGLQSQLDLKQDSIEKEFTALEGSLKAEHAEVDKIEADLNYLRSQVQEMKKLHSQLILKLLPDKANAEKCRTLEELMSGLSKRFYKKEAEALGKIADLKFNARQANDGAAGGSVVKNDDSTSVDTEQQICDFAAQSLVIALNSLVGELDQDDPDLEVLPGMIVRVQVEWDSYVECHTILADALRHTGKVREYQNELILKSKHQQRKLNLEQRYHTLTDVTPNHPSGYGFGGPHHNDRYNLPKLTNNVKEWLPFWATFKEVDDDKKMNNMQKFTKLIQATTEGSEARDIVNVYLMAPDNYKKAMAHLKATYGREGVLVKVYVRELLQIGLDLAVGKKWEFRKLVNTINAQMKNLETLGMTQDKCSQILYPVIETCLPTHVLANWQHSNNFKETLEDLLKFLQAEVNNEADRKLARFQFQQQEKKPQEPNRGRGKNQKDVGGGKKANTPAAAAFHNGESPVNCIFCDGKHKSSACRNATTMTLDQKYERLKEKNGCYICLEKGHPSRSCRNRQKIECELCGKKGSHHKLLCYTLKEDGNKPQQQRQEGNLVNGCTFVPNSQQNYADADTPIAAAGTSNLANLLVTDEVPLQMLVVTVVGVGGKKKKVRAILDEGSQKTSITQNLAEELGFRHLGFETVEHHLFGGIITPPQTHRLVEVEVTGPDGELPYYFEASCVREISSGLANPIRSEWIQALHKKGIKLPDFRGVPDKADLLIGNEYEPYVKGEEKVFLKNGLVAMNTRWGWTLGGKEGVDPSKRKVVRSNLNIQKSLLNLPISALWDLEALGIKDEPSTQSKKELEQQTEEHFLKTVRRNEEGRYEVHLPFHTGAIETLTSNFYAAERRLKSTTADLKKMGYLENYHRLFQQWEEDGMIEAVAVAEDNWKEKGHFLPHRAVVKLSSATTPIRPVFDASAKQKGKPSLNMCLEAGPNYLELIPSILTRFRLKKIAVTADIKKAFQQISVAPEHREFLKFLWWEDPTTCEKLKIYRHCRVVFGVACSPFLLAATLNFHLSQSPSSHAETAEELKKSLYVDNTVTSLKNEEEGQHFKEQCLELLDPAQFDLRGWEKGPTREEKSAPVLGLIWDMKEDKLKVNVEAALEKLKMTPSQRTVLAVVHSLYDPLGMLSPFIIQGKIILRKCHEEKLGWDKDLPDSIKQEFEKWGSQIPFLIEAKFPRHVYYGEDGSKSYHVFSDASGDAVAAAVYLRCETSDGVKISLIHAKSRIAPKKTTIPRLELIGCLIGVRLMKTVAEDVGGEPFPTTYYTDSSTALAWIKGEGPWGIFVQNRVAEIRNETKMEQWRHVPGKENPADLPSRGCSAKKLVESQWWMGPSWLYLEQQHWPVQQEVIPDSTVVEKEKRKSVAVNLAQKTPGHPVEQFRKFSSYPKMLRVASYVMRYHNAVLRRVRDPNPIPITVGALRKRKNFAEIPFPTTAEIEEAEAFILQHVQKSLEPKQLQKLRPFQDERGLWRTSTRILFQFKESFSQPIIIPDKDDIVEKMLQHLHRDNFHVGTQLLLAKVRERFWLLNGRRACRRAVNSCWICKRFRTRRMEVPEPPLPLIRTATGVPFHVTGVDMAGPLMTKKKEKVWVALFTCATYRAVHLELVDSMTTDDFLVAFRAFVCRRGKPSVVHSDNGLNFVGAKAELRKAHQNKLNQYAAEKGINWIHTAPQSPWWGGYWERMIGIMKTLMRSTLGPKTAHRKELVGLLMEVEEAINNRPLTYLPETPDDPVPLTPNMLIRNSGLSHFPELDIRDAESARAAHRRVQRLREALRSRFRAEYLGALQHNRPDGKFAELKPGDVVLIEKDNEKRIGWPLAVIVEVVGGADGFARAYRVRTKNGVSPRPIPAQRLFPMELQEGGGSPAGAVQPEEE